MAYPSSAANESSAGSSPGGPQRENGDPQALFEAKAILVRDVSLEALRSWLASPGSDVEKALRKAMRIRHATLCQTTRSAVARRVLGVAVARGRLSHLLQEVAPGHDCDAELLLELFVVRELPRVLEELEHPCFALAGSQKTEWRQVLADACSRPLFGPNDSATLAKRLSVAWSLPLWMAERWLQHLGPLSAFQLGRAMCQPARLRVNTLRTTRLELMQQLSEHGVRSIPTAESRFGLWLPDGRPPNGGVWQLPGYSQGLFEVQDEGSQILALATEARPGERVLDYCAGRGGKTWLLCALVAPHGRVTAWDVDEDLRKQLLGARAKRASVAELLEVADTKPSSQADVVLVDAPCSSCGVWRRHPSQRWALQESEIDSIAAQQLQILEEASQLVHVGGRLVYATCSLLRAENDAVAERFEQLAGDCFRRWPFESGRHCRTLMPHVEGTDGFFMARWQRQNKASESRQSIMPVATARNDASMGESIIKFGEAVSMSLKRGCTSPTLLSRINPESPVAQSVAAGCTEISEDFEAFPVWRSQEL
ncbi:Ribosomal RNA small subunit methyltransferase B [Symbiodinium microadriaticum]|uniref:Ribosomal RNA small subunit methyltransferase B n=1 Tax=Symbiodinium microadriaticum TaxID=2951 RepID=A0A1Q9EZV0_SYMMI|nr:Ribosomal RNA small subunit methyltransferase B [Symbiodinium microadriaticum]